MLKGGSGNHGSRRLCQDPSKDRGASPIIVFRSWRGCPGKGIWGISSHNRKLEASERQISTLLKKPFLQSECPQ